MLRNRVKLIACSADWLPISDVSASKGSAAVDRMMQARCLEEMIGCGDL